MAQPQRDNIFQRTWHDFQNNPEIDLRYRRMSPGRLQFEACILSIQSIVNLLIQPPNFIQQADLQDYSFAIVDIRNFFLFSSNSPVGTQYPFSELIYPLNKAEQHVIAAVGETNVYEIARTENIQMLNEWLRKTLEQIAGLGEPPP
jgi:hypothetical protein